ncbi:MAG: spiro-SPASM protein, partial [Spirochaetaceae bacterium]
MIVCLVLPTQRYLTEAVGDASTIDRIAGYVRSLPDVERVRVICGTEQAAADLSALLPTDWDVRRCTDLQERSVLDAIIDACVGDDDDVIVAHGDLPFVNVELTVRLLDRHRTYRADYTFADGYPVGLAPEVVNRRVLAHLAGICKPEPFVRQGLFPIVLRDINRIDVETELSATDQRLLRLVLAVDSLANLIVCRALADGAPDRIDEWAAHVARNAAQHRSRPRFVTIQTLEQEVHRTEYSPYPLMRTDVTAAGRVMSIDEFQRIIDELADFAPEAVVHLSMWGEIALHPDAIAMIEYLLASAALSVLVETSGVGWSDASRSQLFAIDDQRMQVIVGIDTNDPELYRELRGAGFDEAIRFAEEAIEHLTTRAHVQAVRFDRSESALDAFYRHWKERTDNVIIQKYDHFCGRLPQRRIGDLSPINRFPCWRLQRDLAILVDGTVPLCREDIDATERLGNALIDGVAAVW